MMMVFRRDLRRARMHLFRKDLRGGAVATVVAIVGLLALTGCTKHFWTKPGATLQTFGQDSVACTQRVAQPVPDRPGYGVVPPDVYRSCLRSLGWQREELGTTKAPPGYFRGIEEGVPVKFLAFVAWHQRPSEPRMTKPGTQAPSLA